MDDIFAFIINETGGLEKADATLEKEERLKEFISALKDAFEEDFLLVIRDDSEPTVNDWTQLKLVFLFKNKNSDGETNIYDPLPEILISEIDRSRPLNQLVEIIAETIFSHLRERRESIAQKMIDAFKVSTEIFQRISEKMPWVKK
jgi:hypothetical protein